MPCALKFNKRGVSPRYRLSRERGEGRVRGMGHSPERGLQQGITWSPSAWRTIPRPLTQPLPARGRGSGAPSVRLSLDERLLGVVISRAPCRRRRFR